MKKSKNILGLMTICLVFSLSLMAQPQMTLWSVDKEHLEDHTKGLAEEWPCGYQYYITYLGEYSSTVLVLEIANKGDQDLVLDELPSFTNSSSDNFSIVSPIAGLTIPAGESAHFGVLYDAPATYASATATLVINSNDPDNGSCSINFQVGDAAEPILQLREGTSIIQPGPEVIRFGTVRVGNTATKSLNFYNSSDDIATIYPCKLLVDIIEFPERPLIINFNLEPYRIPGALVAFPPPFVTPPVGPVITLPPPVMVPMPGSIFVTGRDRIEYMTDLPGTFNLLGGESRNFELAFTPNDRGEKDASFCFHYILRPSDSPPIQPIPRPSPGPVGGFNIYGIQATGALASLPALPNFTLLLFGSFILVLGAYLIGRRL